jgi:hypothetical protein
LGGLKDVESKGDLVGEEGDDMVDERIIMVLNTRRRVGRGKSGPSITGQS